MFETLTRSLAGIISLTIFDTLWENRPSAAKLHFTVLAIIVMLCVISGIRTNATFMKDYPLPTSQREQFYSVRFSTGERSVSSRVGTRDG